MKNKNYFLIALLLGISLQLCGELTDQDRQRYDELVNNFDQDSKTFHQNFVVNQKEDSEIIVNVIAQNRLLQYKNSWTPPTILKALSYAFGIDALISGLWAILRGVDASYSARNIVYTITKPARYALQPISYTINTLNTPIREILYNILYTEYNYGKSFHTAASLSAGTIGLAIALYLNAKAKSNTEKTVDLEKQINIDIAMLQALISSKNNISSGSL